MHQYRLKELQKQYLHYRCQLDKRFGLIDPFQEKHQRNDLQMQDHMMTDLSMLDKFRMNKGFELIVRPDLHNVQPMHRYMLQSLQNQYLHCRFQLNKQFEWIALFDQHSNLRMHQYRLKELQKQYLHYRCQLDKRFGLIDLFQVIHRHNDPQMRLAHTLSHLKKHIFQQGHQHKDIAPIGQMNMQHFLWGYLDMAQVNQGLHHRLNLHQQSLLYDLFQGCWSRWVSICLMSLRYQVDLELRPPNRKLNRCLGRRKCEHLEKKILLRPFVLFQDCQSKQVCFDLQSLRYQVGHYSHSPNRKLNRCLGQCRYVQLQQRLLRPFVLFQDYQQESACFCSKFLHYQAGRRSCRPSRKLNRCQGWCRYGKPLKRLLRPYVLFQDCQSESACYCSKSPHYQVGHSCYHPNRKLNRCQGWRRCGTLPR